MKWPILSRSIRLALWLALGVAVLLLGWRDAAWATPEQNPAGQTIPSPTRRPPRPPRRTPVPYPPPYPAPYASPTPLIAGRVPVGPESDLKLNAAGGDCIAWVTPGDMAVDGALELDPYPVAGVPAPSPAYLYVRSCELKLFDVSGQLVVPLPFAGLSDQQAAPLPFAGPVDVCFPYTADDLALAQANQGLFAVLRFDAQPGAWAEMPLSLDPVNQTACGATIWPGIFALAIRADDPSNLPNTSGELLEATARAAAARNAGTLPPTSVDTSAATDAPPSSEAPSAQRSAGGTIREQPGSTAADAAAPVAEAPAVAPRSNTLIWVLAGVVALLLIAGLIIFRRRRAARQLS